MSSDLWVESEKSVCPSNWTGRNSRGEQVRPWDVVFISFPWLPKDEQTQALLVAGAMVQGLLNHAIFAERMNCCGGRPYVGGGLSLARRYERRDVTSLRQDLYRLLETLTLLIPPKSLGIRRNRSGVPEYGMQYLRNWTSVLASWEGLFVPLAVNSEIAFFVSFGVKKDKDPSFISMTPFQLPLGWVQYQRVNLSVGQMGQSWGARVTDTALPGIISTKEESRGT